MTKQEFAALPYLLTPGEAAQCGYSEHTLNKYAQAGILRVVQPPGAGWRRFQKRQLAQLLGWEDVLDWTRWRREKPLLACCAVCEWTGYDARTIRQIVASGGLVSVNPGGIGDAKYRKDEIAEWLGA